MRAMRRFSSVLLLVALVPVTAAAAGEELFRYQGKVFTPEQLSTRMSQLYGSMLNEQYSALKTLIDEMVFDVYVEQEAEHLGKPVQEVGRALLAVEEPDEAQVNAFYQQNQQQIGKPFEQVRAQLSKLLQHQAMARKRAEIVARIKREGGFELLAAPPALPPVAIDTRGQPFKGHPDAPITLVEFADYQCPNCKRASTLIDTVMARYPDMLKVYYMDFPINRSGISRKVAVGGVCARAQGRFWPYHDLAFAEQDRLDDDAASALAARLDLDMEAFRACLAEPTSRGRVQRSFEEGRRLGVTATPTLFVDGRPFVGNDLLNELGAYIEGRRAASAGGG